MSRGRSFLRWSVLVLGIGLALLYLNSAAFSAWVATGPPNDYPEAWLQRAFGHLCIAMGVFLVSVVLFRLIKPGARIGSVVIICLALTLVIGIAPTARKRSLRKACEERSAMFDETLVRCEKQSPANQVEPSAPERRGRSSSGRDGDQR